MRVCLCVAGLSLYVKNYAYVCVYARACVWVGGCTCVFVCVRLCVCTIVYTRVSACLSKCMRKIVNVHMYTLIHYRNVLSHRPICNPNCILTSLLIIETIYVYTPQNNLCIYTSKQSVYTHTKAYLMH
jgi:hypothetical protein